MMSLKLQTNVNTLRFNFYCCLSFSKIMFRIYKYVFQSIPLLWTLPYLGIIYIGKIGTCVKYVFLDVKFRQFREP